MRRGRFFLYRTACRRCGCELYTGSRSILGADAAKARLDRLCEACTTPAERDQMLEAQAAAILAQVRS